MFFYPDEFCQVIEKTDLHSKIPFRVDGSFVQRYFGKKKERLINYAEFSQLLHDFHEEYAMEAFKSKDPDGTGYISALEFQEIMVSVKRHLLTEDVKDNLVAVSIKIRIYLLAVKYQHNSSSVAFSQVTEGHKVSFAYFMAFNSLLNNMELIKRVYLNATGGSRLEAITKDELLLSSQRMSQITPLEIDILYQLTGVLHQSG